MEALPNEPISVLVEESLSSFRTDLDRRTPTQTLASSQRKHSSKFLTSLTGSNEQEDTISPIRSEGVIQEDVCVLPEDMFLWESPL